jgi:hypothetical protein
LRKLLLIQRILVVPRGIGKLTIGAPLNHLLRIGNPEWLLGEQITHTGIALRFANEHQTLQEERPGLASLIPLRFLMGRLTQIDRFVPIGMLEPEEFGRRLDSGGGK